MSEFNDTQRDVLAAVCDTVVPSLAHDPDPDGFFARKASDLWVPQVIEYLVTSMPDDQRTALLALLEVARRPGFRAPLPALPRAAHAQLGVDRLGGGGGT